MQRDRPKHRSEDAGRGHHRATSRRALEGVDGAAAALVYVPHTTAGVTIQEHADPAVARDLEAGDGADRRQGLGLGAHRGGRGERAIPRSSGARGAAGARAGRERGLALGTWQGIFFCEFDGPRQRKVYVTALG